MHCMVAITPDLLNYLKTLCADYVKVKTKFILQLMVSWPVCPCVRPPSGTHDQFLLSFSLKFSCVAGLLLWDTLLDERTGL
jgi:hypothetical protein